MQARPKLPSSDAELVLYVLEGHHGIPSVDPLSAQMIYLLKIHDVRRVEVKTCKYYVSAKLPRLEYENQVITHPAVIRSFIEYVIEVHCENSTYHRHINDKYPLEKGRINAYQNVVSKFLEKIAMVNGWASKENIMRSTKLYSKGICYPFKFIFVRNLRSKMDDEMFNLYDYNCKDEIIDKIYDDAAACLQDFSNVLGDNRFMFGKHPSTLDIYLCSYLAPALLLNYPDDRMKQLIYSCNQNLELYIKKFVDLYGDDYEAQPKKIEPSSDSASIPVLLTAGLFAFTAMFLFAKAHGIVYKC